MHRQTSSVVDFGGAADQSQTHELESRGWDCTERRYVVRHQGTIRTAHYFLRSANLAVGPVRDTLHAATANSRPRRVSAPRHRRASRTQVHVQFAAPPPPPFSAAASRLSLVWDGMHTKTVEGGHGHVHMAMGRVRHTRMTWRPATVLWASFFWGGR